MSVEPGQQAPRSFRVGNALLWILLIVSIAMNAFFVGAAWRVGSVVSQRAPMSENVLLSPRGFLSNLAPQTRKRMMDELRTNREEFATYFRDLVASRKAVLDAMKAEPFDAAAYRTALEKSAEFDAAARRRAIDYYVSFMEGLTPEERKAVVEGFERRGAAWGRRAWRRGAWSGRPREAEPPGPPPEATERP